MVQSKGQWDMTHEGLDSSVYKVKTSYIVQAPRGSWKNFAFIEGAANNKSLYSSSGEIWHCSAVLVRYKHSMYCTLLVLYWSLHFHCLHFIEARFLRSSHFDVCRRGPRLDLSLKVSRSLSPSSPYSPTNLIRVRAPRLAMSLKGNQTPL